MAKADDIAAALEAIIGGNDEEATVKHYLDTGFPPLNYASSSRFDGGFPVGRGIEIAGPSSAGKTAISTAALISAQKAGGWAGFFDYERSFQYTLAERMGLDTKNRFTFKKPQTFEQGLTIAVQAAIIIREKKAIPKDAPICWVFDSLADMVPQSARFEMKNGKVVGEKSMEDRNMNDNTSLARATSAHFPAFAAHCDELGICAIFLNQMRSKIGVMYGDPRKTTGGNAAEHFFSQRLWLTSERIKKGDEIIGSQVTGTFVKNKIARPFLKADWRFMFQPDGTGRFDIERSLVEFLADQGALTIPAKGFVEYKGKRIGREALAREIQKNGEIEELRKLLPKNYEPEVVSVVDLEADDVGDPLESDAA